VLPVALSWSESGWTVRGWTVNEIPSTPGRLRTSDRVCAVVIAADGQSPSPISAPLSPPRRAARRSLRRNAELRSMDSWTLEINFSLSHCHCLSSWDSSSSARHVARCWRPCRGKTRCARWGKAADTIREQHADTGTCTAPATLFSSTPCAGCGAKRGRAPRAVASFPPSS